MNVSVPMEVIKGKIYLIRGQKVLLDSDLAVLYGIETKNLNRVVKRNLSRFPQDFMFQLTSDESKGLRFQIGTSNEAGRGGRRYNPFVFTEQGVAMLSSVLNTERAVQANIAIMRAFVQLRELATSNRAISRRLDELEQKYDSQFKVVFEAIREMMALPAKKVRKIGFTK
ncbi:MAG: ORF6N domain-containing protein [Geobacteraceae bacterium]|nr:ORF6N domain-containing protein [Geobacteraceae bacterium]